MLAMTNTKTLNLKLTSLHRSLHVNSRDMLGYGESVKFVSAETCGDISLNAAYLALARG